MTSVRDACDFDEDLGEALCADDLAGKLPIGNPSFESIRKGGFIYVDKTRGVVELARRQHVMLVRPRRFGKSLLVSTLESLFRDGAPAFKGLDAYTLWNEPQRKVVHLDFSTIRDASTREECEERLAQHLALAIVQAESIPWSEAIDEVLRMQSLGALPLWEMYLMRQEARSLVVLIDEYDAPLTARLQDPAGFEIWRGVLEGFFQTTKRYSGKLRFLFVTGIMRFREASLFAAFNNIVDVSQEPAFGDLLGFTEEEIKRFFRPYVERAGSALGMRAEDVLKAMRRYYEGFCFDEAAAKHVYQPWSVLRFLDQPSTRFKHYWFESVGAPAVLVKFLRHHRLLAPEAFDAEHSVPKTLLASSGFIDGIDGIDPRELLARAGYLTILAALGPDVTLGYPNEEVREAMAELYRRAFWPSPSFYEELVHDFVDAVNGADAGKLQAALNRLVHALDYQDFSLNSEAPVRQLVQVFCLGAALPVRVEVHSPKGCSDLEFSTRQADVVFEFKVVDVQTKAAQALDRALQQIRQREYGAERAGRRLLRFGIVFSREERKFCAVGLA